MNPSIQIELHAIDDATEVTIKAPLLNDRLPCRLILRVELDPDGRTPGVQVEAPIAYHHGGPILTGIKTLRDVERLLEVLDREGVDLRTKRDDNSHNDSSVDSSEATPEDPTVEAGDTKGAEFGEDGELA